MKRALKITGRIFELLLMLALLLSAWNIRLVNYGLSQLKGQLTIVWNAKPVEEVMSDSATPDSLKKKLLLIEEIKKFANDSLGLKRSKNYTTVYNQHGKPVLWVLTASEKYQMKSYEWNFPLLGSVGYKGFFNREKGKKEQHQLDAKGFDTDYGTTSAWSTLGWFRDPILSNILFRNDGQVAELIIHEMTHATLYVKSSVDFNENLASATGEEGAKQFLKYKFSEASTQLNDYLHEQSDYNLFAAHMLRGSDKLDSLYKTFSSSPEKNKSEKKNEMLKQIVAALDTVSFFDKERYRKLFEKRLPNNAYLLGFRRYDAQKDEMKKELREKFNDNINAYVEFLKQKYQ